MCVVQSTAVHSEFPETLCLVAVPHSKWEPGTNPRYKIEQMSLCEMGMQMMSFLPKESHTIDFSFQFYYEVFPHVSSRVPPKTFPCYWCFGSLNNSEFHGFFKR